MIGTISKKLNAQKTIISDKSPPTYRPRNCPGARRTSRSITSSLQIACTASVLIDDNVDPRTSLNTSVFVWNIEMLILNPLLSQRFRDDTKHSFDMDVFRVYTPST